MRRLIVVLSLLIWPALLPQPAAAGPGQVSIMQDDDQILYRGDAVRDQTLRRMKFLGVDVVRATVLWTNIAHGARRPGFVARDPDTYPAQNWDPYDSLVKSAGGLGIRVLFNVTGPGPEWAHRRSPVPRLQRTWKPRPRAFYDFVTAVGRRYSGTVRDSTDGQMLPRVRTWSIWNEPNQGGWLSPQFVRGRPASPQLYRELYFHARQALDDTGHGDDFVLIGETAPLGRTGGSPTGPADPMRPKQFIRELLCERKDGPGCDRFARSGPLRAGGWAHHPYTRALRPRTRDRHPDSISMANIGALGTLLDRLAARTGRIAPGLPVLLTEFGYETNPPDPFAGISPERQAAYINEGEWLAYRDPRIFAQAQFQLRDVLPVGTARRGTRPYWFTYQSGLFESSGVPKPAASAYALPLIRVARTRDTVTFWGQLRFVPNDTLGRVKLQWQPDGGVWEDIGGVDAVRDPLGFFFITRSDPGPGRWRAIAASTGVVISSREVPVG